MALALLASLLLAGSLSPSLAMDPPLTYQYRLLREEQSEFRSLERSSILYGRTEFRVAAPAQHRVVAATVVGEGRDPLTGAEEILCRSSNPSNRCSVDFGAVISRQRFRIDAELNDQKSRATEVFSEEFLTLDTHPEGVVTTSGPAVFVERVQTETFPPDEVRRFVRVEKTASKRQDEAVLYRDDLDQDNFRVEVAGIPVVPYAYTARVFGPFRLHSSPNLDDSRRRLNEETLAALEQFLLEPPLPAWDERWQIEEDDQIRSVLFESWVSINLKRLQTGGTGKKERRLAEEAYERLRRAGDLAELAPDPRLAREAAIVAGWYRADHRQHFDAASPDAGRY